jgi:cytoplasmic tRNA 2-thiolation protein 2
MQGQGYSFPADIQYVDSRWPVTVVLPLRDCLARELDVYCRLAK